VGCDPPRESPMFYQLDFRCDDREPLQARLNRLYDYADDLETRVLHRCRLNLFSLLLGELKVRGLIARRDTALDIGCNAGGYSKIVSDAGYRRVEGLDLEPWMIDRANAEFASDDPEHAIRFRVENAEEMDASRQFDFILCTEATAGEGHR
jgi:2-polyprenyl-3-methyl-5-hydroxy-6-metoxy-1,4-benzoquinol methylase